MTALACCQCGCGQPAPIAAYTSRLTFNAEKHEYRLRDGTRVPSVTEILRAVGVAVDFDMLGAMSSRLNDQIEFRRQLGTALHADAWAYDDDDLDWATVDPRVEPYLRAWVTFRENTGVRPLTRERIVYHPALGYCGTMDGIFALSAGGKVLIDMKTGDCDAAGTQYQTAAYLAAYQIEHPTIACIERWGVHLTPEHAVPYRIHRYMDWTDFAKFQSFVTTYYCQAARRCETRR